MDKDLELKLVKEQRFCAKCNMLAKSASGDPDNWHCRAPQNKLSTALNLVTGVYLVSWKEDFCRKQREQELTADSLHGLCGPQGNWFVIRPEEPPLRPEGDRSINKAPKGTATRSAADEL